MNVSKPSFQFFGRPSNPFLNDTEIKMKKFDLVSLKSSRGSVMPYLFGWMLGIPGSLLFLVFLLRGCH
jgi:hypothetical protein